MIFFGAKQSIAYLSKIASALFVFSTFCYGISNIEAAYKKLSKNDMIPDFSVNALAICWACLGFFFQPGGNQIFMTAAKAEETIKVPSRNNAVVSPITLFITSPKLKLIMICKEQQLRFLENEHL